MLIIFGIKSKDWIRGRNYFGKSVPNLENNSAFLFIFNFLYRFLLWNLTVSTEIASCLDISGTDKPCNSMSIISFSRGVR